MIEARRNREGWGADFGTTDQMPSDLPVVHSDTQLANLLSQGINQVHLVGGDLARTLGVAQLSQSQSTLTNIDAAKVTVNNSQHWFVAHLIARRSWWRGRIVAVANASFYKDWNIAPRTHPGDSLLDILDADLPLKVRLAARKRLVLGTHVPHPDISQRRVTEAVIELVTPADLYIDGKHLTRADHFSVEVVPNAIEAWF